MKMFAIILSGALTVLSLAAAPPDEHGKPQPPHQGPPRHRGNYGRGPQLWRAFSELSDEERAAMTKLQREDPEKFREAMSKKAEEIIQREKAERQKMQELAEKFKSAKSDEEKAAVKQQLTDLMKKRFTKRLAGNRRQLEAMKRQTVKLEQELDRREKNADKIVSMLVDSLLSGKKPFPPPGKPGGRPGFPQGRRPLPPSSPENK